jgi:hypothetical protein
MVPEGLIAHSIATIPFTVMEQAVLQQDFFNTQPGYRDLSSF